MQLINYFRPLIDNHRAHDISLSCSEQLIRFVSMRLKSGLLYCLITNGWAAPRHEHFGSVLDYLSVELNGKCDSLGFLKAVVTFRRTARQVRPTPIFEAAV